MEAFSPPTYDFVSIGGGAAGFFGAITYAEARPGARVLIVERSGQLLTKVRISGGGRCNVTHACFEPRALSRHYPRGEKALIGAFHRWGSSDTVEWFRQRGVVLKTEADGRMFPSTDTSETVVRCLQDAAQAAGVEIQRQTELAELIRLDHGGYELKRKDGVSIAQSAAVLLATGGMRQGRGAEIVSSLGHTVVPPVPSLFTFKIQHPCLRGLSGVSVGAAQIAIADTVLSTSGPCLITHWGLSGPAVLKLSAWGARVLAQRDYRFRITVNWTGRTVEQVEGLLGAMRAEAPRKKVASGHPSMGIPFRLWQRLWSLARSQVTRGETDDGEHTTWSQLTKVERIALVQCLCKSEFEVNGQSVNKDEFVTAGGVPLTEVDGRTLESRVCPGLYFAGEVLDIDGITGGFNFQAAWTTSRLAALAAADRAAG